MTAAERWWWRATAFGLIAGAIALFDDFWWTPPWIVCVICLLHAVAHGIETDQEVDHP